MAVDQKIREALRLEELKLPQIPKSLTCESKTTSIPRERTPYAQVILDEQVEVEKVTGREVIDLKTAIRDRLREQGVELWPYISLAKQSELDREDSEE